MRIIVDKFIFYAQTDSQMKHFWLIEQITIFAYSSSLLLQDNTIVAFFSQRSGSVETFGSNDYISYEIECSDIADSGVDRTVSNLLGAT